MTAPRAIATVLLARPEKRNALSRDMIIALRDRILADSEHAELRVVIVKGFDGVFSAGADVNALAALDTPEEARGFIATLHELCQAIRDCPVPVIASVEGPCIGGGVELIAACDVRVAARGAVFAMPEVKLGLPSVIDAVHLPRLMGTGPAAALLYTGDTITAEQAYHWGLVTALVDDGGADAEAERVARAIANNGPEAIRKQKQLLRHWEDASVEASIQRSIDVFAEAYSGDEPREGTRAWLDKRPPKWTLPDE